MRMAERVEILQKSLEHIFGPPITPDRIFGKTHHQLQLMAECEECFSLIKSMVFNDKIRQGSPDEFLQMFCPVGREIYRPLAEFEYESKTGKKA